MDMLSEPILDVVLHQPVRTRLAAFLFTRGEATFTELKKQLEVTDGNLDAHMKKFVTTGYIKSKKSSDGKRSRTTYSMTKKGQNAFEEYIETMKRILSFSNIKL